MMNTVCEYDGMTFERTPDGKWICKVWAMKGPTGCMMNKEVPGKYAEPIEAAYQESLKPEKRIPNFRVLGIRHESGKLIAPKKEEPPKEEPKEKKTRKRKAKAPRDSTIKKDRKSLGGAFNPFAKGA